jgi:hypothetical protein
MTAGATGPQITVMMAAGVTAVAGPGGVTAAGAGTGPGGVTQVRGAGMTASVFDDGNAEVPGGVTGRPSGCWSSGP